MIQNRITICGSAQPFFSKWWWIGAIRNTRLPVRLGFLPSILPSFSTCNRFKTKYSGGKVSLSWLTCAGKR